MARDINVGEEAREATNMFFEYCKERSSTPRLTTAEDIKFTDGVLDVVIDHLAGIHPQAYEQTVTELEKSNLEKNNTI